MTKNRHSQEEKIDRLDKAIYQIKNDMAILIDLKEDIKKNSEFRIQSRSIIGFVAFIFAVFGAGIMWILSKLSS